MASSDLQEVATSALAASLDLLNCYLHVAKPTALVAIFNVISSSNSTISGEKAAIATSPSHTLASNTPLIPRPATTANKSTASQPRKGEGLKIEIAIIGSFLGITTCVIAIWRHLKYQKRKRVLGKQKIEKASSEMIQPYLQQKGELGTVAKAKYELHSISRPYELEDSTEIHELPIAKGVQFARSRQELTGGEHAHEMH